MNTLKAIELLYDKLGLEFEMSDITLGYLTDNVTRTLRDVLWYVDSCHNEAIYIDNLVFLTESEIEAELC